MGFVHGGALTLLWKPELLGFVLLEEKQNVEESRRDLIGVNGLFILRAPSPLKSTPNSMVMTHSPTEAAATANTREGTSESEPQRCR